MNDSQLKIFSGQSNYPLAEQISRALDIELGSLTIKRFADSELWVKFEENIRGKDVFIIQSTNAPAGNIIELLLVLDAAVRASAHSVTVVIPYFGYARQDRKDMPRVPVSAKVMVDIFTATGASRIITMDLHSTQIQGFANIPFDHLYSRMVLLAEINKLNLDPKKAVVLAPDMGSARMSQAYAKRLGMHFALIDKRRYAANQAEVVHLIGELEGRDVLIIDDMIDTAGTIVNAAKKALDNGANSIYAIGTHALFSGQAVDRMKSIPFEKIIVTDTVDIPAEKRLPNMTIVTVANIFAEAIQRINRGDSVSALFDF
ncbi:MAG: ribose-phosphate pyrophosphokinase [Candidatus Marinimicrobia bacterium]|nr:ribose-phosphate pyrophosphokinase [Candidatus Neomarinimicrobiota bacterium]